MKSGVTIVGLDGATFRLILPLVEEGKLPVLKELMQEGSWGKLESTIHPLSPQAWASFMTGKNPGKHGVFEFVEHKPNSYELCYVNGGCVQGKKLWEILSEAGKRVCVINVPFTYPPSTVNGCLIAGLDAPGLHSEFCYHTELLAEITAVFGEYRLRQTPYKAKPETYLTEILGQFDYTLEVAKYLKAKESWDLFMVVFESTDLVQHFYWHYAFPQDFGIAETHNTDLKTAISDVYRRIDGGLKELLALCGEAETVMVMSDHGFSACRKIFFMDNWLNQHGYLARNEGERTTHALTRNLHVAFQKYFPNRWKGGLTRFMPFLREKMRSYLNIAPIDWENTKAFSLGIDSTNIFVNLKGKYPSGIVEQGQEYEKLREEIIALLTYVRDPDTGKRIVERVYKREELYHGECLSKAPDLLVTWKGFEYNTRRGYREKGNELLGSSLEFSDVSAYSSLQKSGTHHVDGVFIANGPHIRSNVELEGARIVDLAPTILYLLGEKVPEGMDGRVMEELMRGQFLSKNPVEIGLVDSSADGAQSTTYGKEEEKYIRDKLRGLGYID